MLVILALFWISSPITVSVEPSQAEAAAKACWGDRAGGWKRDADNCVRLLDTWQAEIDKSKPRPKPVRPGMLLSLDSWQIGIDSDARYNQISWKCDSRCGTLGDGVTEVTVYERADSGRWAKVLVRFHFGAWPNRRTYNLDTGGSQTNYGRKLTWDVHFRGELVGGNYNAAKPVGKPKVTEIR